jgi:hypothetical protein
MVKRNARKGRKVSCAMTGRAILCSGQVISGFVKTDTTLVMAQFTIGNIDTCMRKSNIRERDRIICCVWYVTKTAVFSRRDMINGLTRTNLPIMT